MHGKLPPRVRLARVILRLSSSADGQCDNSLHLTVEKLGSRAGLSRRAVTALLTELRRGGLIGGRGARLTVLNSEALRRMANQ